MLQKPELSADSGEPPGSICWIGNDLIQLPLPCCLSGDVFGSKDFFYGLGIFFDTYSNHNGEHQASSFVTLFK